MEDVDFKRWMAIGPVAIVGLWEYQDSEKNPAALTKDPARLPLYSSVKLQKMAKVELRDRAKIKMTDSNSKMGQVGSGGSVDGDLMGHL
jgi:hypothetical protein